MHAPTAASVPPPPDQLTQMLSRRILGMSALIQMIGVVATFATSVIVSRAQGPEGQGHWAAIRAVVDLGAVVLAFGLPTAFPYFVNMNRVSARALAKFVVFYSVATLPLAVVGTLALLHLTSLGRGFADNPALWLLAAATSLVTAHSLVRGLSLAGASTGTFNLVTAALPLAHLVAVAALLSRGLDGLLYAAVAGPLAALALCAPAWRVAFASKASGAARVVPYRELIGFGGWTLVAGVVAAILPAVNYELMARGGSPPSDVGHFSIAVLALGAMLMPANLLGPLVYNAWSKATDPDQVRKHYGQLLRLCWIGSLVTLAIGIPAAPQAIRWVLGESFQPAVVPTQIMLLAAPLGYASRLMANVLMADGQLRSYTLVTATRVIVVIAMLGLRSDSISLSYVAWSWVAGEAAAMALNAALLSRQRGWRVSDLVGLSGS